MIKKTISQNWQILEKISSGAFGDIYKIQNRKTGKFAALKIFKPEFQNRKILIKTNFAAASEISHKNCLKMIEWIETDGQFGFIMELIVGKPITILKVRSSPEIINSFINICNGLDAIHSKSFIHRDLKPSNILINKNGDVKITDFDFLKTGKNLLAKDEYLGSIRYSSPEQCIDPKAVDQRSDLYSLGIILFEIFTGKVPFDGRSWEEIATKQVKSGFIVPKKIKKLIPESIVSIIQKLLQKKSEDRYQNARELAIALQSCLLDKNSEIIDAESNFLLSPRFINREDQLQKLEKIFRESQNNISRSILISGEKGSGKSRLIKHFIDSISVDHLIFKSKADRTQNQSIKSILGKIIKADEQESKTDQEEILKDNITALSAIFPNLKKSPFYQQNGNSNTSQNEIITAIFETIRAFQIASDKPMILVFEDFQFADDLSSKWISKAIGKSMKLFLIVSYNSNEIKGTFIEQTKQFPPERTEKIVLENFDLKNTFLQINSMLGNSGNLKPSTLKKIYSLTNGNPLFIEELMKFFLKEDFLKQKNGSWKFNEDAFSAIPKNISILLNHELTKLSANSLEILKYVSLFGEKFSLEILTSVLDQKTISKCLEEALALNIIEQNEDTGDFSFCKSFTQKSLEESLTKGKKKEIYRKIADFLEAEYLSEKLIEVEQLADFYYQAEVPEKAIKYLDPAIRSCIRKFSFSKAIAYLLKLISLLKKQKSSEKTLIEYYIKLGKLQRNDDMKNAEESFQNALQLAEKVDDPELMIESNANLGWLNVIRGHLEKSLFYYEKRAKLAEKIDDISIKARAYAGLANIYNRINRYDESIENNKKYIALSEKIGRKDNICVALQNIGSAYYHKNEPENALAYLNKSWKIAQEIDHLTTLTNVCCVYGLIYTETGEFDKALQYYSDNIKFALKNHKKRSLSIAYGNMGNTYSKIGNFKKAVELFRNQLEIDEEMEDERGICLGCSNLANVYKKLNLFSKAEKLYDRAIKKGKKLKMKYFLCSFLHKKADLYFLMEKMEKAESLNNEALKIANEVNRQKIIISAEILKSKIIFRLDKNVKDKYSSLNKLYKLLDQSADQKDIALLNYEIFELTGSEFHKNEALIIFEDLFEKHPFFEYKNKIEQMKKQEIAKAGKETASSISLVHSLVKFMNPETAYAELLKYLTDECRADNCQIVNYDRRTGKFETLALSPELDTDDLDFSESILQESIITNKIHFHQNAVESIQFQDNQSVIGKSFLSVIVVPIKSGGSTKGALYLDRRNIENGTFKKEDLEKVKTISKIIAPILSKKDEIEQYRIKAEVQNYGLFIGNSRKMQNLYKEIYYAAKVDSSVYIYGESGTGKELVAKALHNLSKRHRNRFVALNCAAIPNELAESELFGHEKGAFTGAASIRKGKFELASGGTLFLDEIGELPLMIQAKLLRVLEEKEITRLGGERTIPIDVRVITATQKILEDEVEKQNFRKDLLHRLNILKILIPPLREREDDVILLAEFFLNHFCEQYGKSIPGFSQNTLEALQKNTWSENNVRELKNVIERAVIQHETDFPIFSEELSEHKLIFTKSDKNHTEVLEGESLEEIIGKLECDILKQTLAKNNWNKTKTAEELKIGRPRVDKIIKKYHIQNSSS